MDDVNELTLQELLTGILPEEGIVRHRSSKIVNHKLEHGLDLLLRVTRVLGEGRVPFATIHHKTRKVHSARSDERWGVFEEPMV